MEEPLSSKSVSHPALPLPAETFLTAGLYLRNWSQRTVHTYRQGLTSLYQVVPEPLPTKLTLDAWVMSLRARGLTPGGCNMYIRTVNSYLSWLHEDGQLDQPLRVKVLRAPHHQITLLSVGDVRALLTYTPPTRVERRTWALVLLLLDTGLRIDEALGLERARVDLDSLILVVMGKGSKERAVPVSLELRKVLHRWVRIADKASPSRYLFAAHSGARLLYRNVFREIQRLCTHAGVRTHVHPHLFRHQFAVTYMRQGGDVYRLSRLLGHTSVSTTQLYLRSMGVEDLRTGHEHLTPLSVAR
jgi:site-specific recombinase XerD